MSHYKVLKSCPRIVQCHDKTGPVFREHIAQPVARLPRSGYEVQRFRLDQRQPQFFESICANDVSRTEGELHEPCNDRIAPFDKWARKTYRKENHCRVSPVIRSPQLTDLV